MILNVMSPDGKVAVAVPMSNLLEVMNQVTIAESLMKANTIMNKNGARFNLPLVLVKSLVSGD